MSRYDSPQPNLTGLGIIASLGARFWALVLAIGVITGLGASALTWLLHRAEHLTYGGHAGTLLGAVEAAPGWRRIVALFVAAVIVVGGLALLGRRSTGGTEVSEGIWLRSGRLDFPRSVSRGIISIVTVGMGVSLGREAAPQLFGAATASRLAVWAELPTWQRRLLVACGAGAGFAAIYNVPLGGALMALEVLLGTLALPLVLPALLCAVSATAVAWIFLGDRPLYHVLPYAFHPSQLAFAVVAGPVIGLVAVGWARLISAANHVRPTGWGRWLAPFAVFLALAAIALAYPQLLGNGRGIIQLAVLDRLSLGVLVALFLLKPLVTAACVASGAPGGLFTPTFALGVLLASVGGTLWNHVWPGAPEPSLALVGGGAFLAAAMQGPIAGVVLVLELTGHFQALLVPTIIAVVEATVLSRRFGAASIYSARLGRGDTPALTPTGNAAAVSAIYALDETLVQPQRVDADRAGGAADTDRTGDADPKTD
ncbi:MAG TPA: chloride channel protein [Solirubrobacteraceae bacterium]|nr:chloride channel protein [Solirubrobacteraceae bacterium]